jgi:pyruvate,water dikinase
MTRAGIPVPPGFVVLAPAFTRFLEETDVDVEVDHQLHRVNVKEMESVEEASEVLRGLIHKKKMPKDLTEEIGSAFQKLKAPLVAVRSSATAEDGSFASWAGELESYLNTTKEKLFLHVQKCWSSLFTPRAIFYRFEKGLHRQNHIDFFIGTGWRSI